MNHKYKVRCHARLGFCGYMSDDPLEHPALGVVILAYVEVGEMQPSDSLGSHGDLLLSETNLGPAEDGRGH